MQTGVDRLPEVNRIFALARSSATQRAWQLFVESGLDQDDSVEVLTLKGRLLKDRARQAAETERAALFAQAGAAYADAAALRPDSYPLINAAAMALFAGDAPGAASIAADVLKLVESDPDQGETPYWREATRAEALLLLDRDDEAQASLAAAMMLAPQAWEDHASTLRQFAAVLREFGKDTQWLDPLRPAPTLHYSGILRIAADDDNAAAAIGKAIADIAPGFGYGALAAGADIMAAEALVAGGAELHVVLPSDPADFRSASVEPHGSNWVDRYERLLDSAHALIICGDGERTSAAGVALAEYHAMGLAAERAGQLETRAVALRIGPAARSSLGDPWLLSGRETVRVDVESDTTTPFPLPIGKLHFDIVIDGGGVQSFTDIAKAVAALAGAGEDIAAIDCRTGEQQRVRALLSRGEPGMIVASRNAALALLACGAVQKSESIGEMATVAGPIELCLTRLSPTSR